MRLITLLLLTLMLALGACTDQGLTLFPYGSVTAEETFVTEAGAEAALVGMYDQFTPGYFMFAGWFMESYGNTGIEPGPNGDATLYQLVVDPEQSAAPNRWWSDTYPHIHSVNAFVRAFRSEVFRDPARAAAALGEARFIRAMCYFRLVQLYGGVPLVTEATPLDDIFPERASEAEVYEYLIEELEYCVDNLQTEYRDIVGDGLEEFARPTQGAAMALLAKVLMSGPTGLRDYARAEELCRAVMEDFDYSLLPHYEDLWIYANKNNSESLFLISLTQEGDRNGSNIAGLTAPGQKWYRPTEDTYFNRFDSTDTRRDINIAYKPPVIPGIPFPRFEEIFVRKYWYDEEAYGQSATFPDNAFPFYYLRLADIILLRAEAQAQLGWSGNLPRIVDALNQIRDRAYQGELTGDFSYRAEVGDFATQKDVLMALAEERFKELFFELHYFFDLKRMGLAQEVLSWPDRPFEDYMLVFPISAQQMVLNPSLVQNPGY